MRYFWSFYLLRIFPGAKFIWFLIFLENLSQRKNVECISNLKEIDALEIVNSLRLLLHKFQASFILYPNIWYFDNFSTYSKLCLLEFQLIIMNIIANLVRITHLIPFSFSTIWLILAHKQVQLFFLMHFKINLYLRHNG
jgi:hypothetical protein